MRTPREIAPRIEVAIIPGVVPAVTLANRGHEPVTVIGARGEPFLRIGSDGCLRQRDEPDMDAIGTRTTDCIADRTL